MKNIIVLGSNSFAGSSFINYALNKNYKITGISRSKEKSKLELKYKDNLLKQKNFKFYRLDINKDINKIIKIIKKIKKPVFVIDFAGQGMVAESWNNPDQWFKTNVISKIKLIEELKKIKINKYIRISTPEVYGSSSKMLLEENAHNPTTPYALTHSTIDKYLKLQKKEFNFPVLILRFSNFYGEYQPIYRIIPKTIISILKGKKLSLHGGGLSSRSFIYIDDFSNAIFKAINLKKQKQIVINVSSKEIITIKDLVKTICKKMNTNYKNIVKISKDRRAKDKKYFMNSKRAKNILKWKPYFEGINGFKKALHITTEWYKNNPDFYKNYSKKII